MAVYKVPQDVEADDKLIGPFSFRQFIYLIIVALAGMISWGLAQLFVPLAVLPLPIIIFFGALALPLRKDQPMEIYMAAIVSFYLKPRQRLWDPDGIDSLIEVTAPKIVELQLTKDLTQTEAQRRFSYLAQIVDTKGWAVRGAGAVQPTNSSINSDVYFEAQQVTDVLDDNNSTAIAMRDRLDKSDARHRQEVDDIMHGKLKQSTPPPEAAITPTAIPSPANYFNNIPGQPTPTSAPTVTLPEHLEFNPYPDMSQSVIQPEGAKPTVESANTSEKGASADIINLANNNDLSIATIEREVNRRIKKKEEDQEVVISLR